VLNAKLPVGSRLPPERELATSLNLSRTTISAAYEALRHHGYLVSKRGAGSWTAVPTASPRAAASSGASSGARWGDRLDTLDGIGDTAAAEPLDLTLAAPAAGAAADHIARAAGQALAELPRYVASHGYDSLGLPQLRGAIADRYERRGLPTNPDQILITSGAQHAIDLIQQVLVRPGERVIVESPTYPRALDAVVAHSARPVAVDIDGTGWTAAVVDAFSATLRQAAPSLSYLIADFHNPTGLSMSDETREQVAAAVARSGCYAVVDETLVDLALDAELAESPLPSLPPVASYDRADRVISVGSLSKCVWGGLRLGWIRADARLVQRLAIARSRLDIAGPVLEQLIGVQLLASYDDIVVGRRAELRARRDALVAAVRKALPAWGFDVPAGGLSLWVELDRPVSGALVASAAREGVRLAPGSRFGSDSRFERRLRVPFTLPADSLLEAVRRLAIADGRVREGEPVALADMIV
jgi:DNA-binding transcriptional MocR family regulator